MAFTEVTKTTTARGSASSHASFTKTKSGAGSLRINSNGMEFLKTHGIKLVLGDTVKVFYDPETRRVAIVKSPEGRFRLGKNSSRTDSLRISSKDLTELIGDAAEYEMQKSDEYDVVLAPRK